MGRVRRVKKTKAQKPQKPKKEIDMKGPRVTKEFNDRWEAFCDAKPEKKAVYFRAALAEYMDRHGNPQAVTAAAVGDALRGAKGRGKK